MKQFPQGIFQTLDWLVKQVDRLKYQVSQLGGTPGDPGGPGGGGSGIAVLDEGTSLTTATSIDFTGGGVIATNSGTNVTVTIPGSSVYTECIDLDQGDFTVSLPGVFTIINPAAGGLIIIDMDPADYIGKTITFINKEQSAANIDTGVQVPLYQGTTTEVNQINGFSTLEIVATSDACGTAWRTKPTTNVLTRENIHLAIFNNDVLDYDPVNLYVGTDGGGFYSIDVPYAGSNIGGAVYFPLPSSFKGQRIVIVNMSANKNTAIANNGDAPKDIDGSTLLSIPATTVVEVISTGGTWRILTLRTV